MTLSVVSKVDDTTKAILTLVVRKVKVELCIVPKLIVSLANVYYEIRGTGSATLTLGEHTLSLTGFGNWGLKENEKRLTPQQELNSATELKVTTDANVSKFNLAIELQKEIERPNI